MQCLRVERTIDAFAKEAPTYQKFLEEYACSTGRQPRPGSASVQPMNLWLYGQKRWLDEFEKQLVAHFGKSAAVLRTADLSALFVKGRRVSQVESSLRRAKVLLLDVDISLLVDDVRAFVDQIVDFRYAHS